MTWPLFLEGFNGTQPCSLVYVLYRATFILSVRVKWLGQTLYGWYSLKYYYLTLYTKFANPWLHKVTPWSYFPDFVNNPICLFWVTSLVPFFVTKTDHQILQALFSYLDILDLDQVIFLQLFCSISAPSKNVYLSGNMYVCTTSFMYVLLVFLWLQFLAMVILRVFHSCR